MEIIKTQPGEQFEGLVKTLYEPGSGRHMQGEGINHGFLHACYLALEDGKPKARLALYNNPHLIYNGLKAAAIGNFESAEDTRPAKALFEEAFKDAKSLGAGYILGPMNGSTWDEYRFRSNFEKPPFLLEPTHLEYYNQLFLKAGFEPVAKYFSSLNKAISHSRPEVLHKEQSFRESGITFRNINMAHYERELDKLYPFLSKAFSTNFLYTPISKENFNAKYLAATKLIDPDFIILAEDQQENLKGFIFAYQDHFCQQEKRIVVKTLARDNDKSLSGLGNVLGDLIFRKAAEKGFQSSIHAFMIENGTSTGLSGNYSGEPFKHYFLYGRAI
jgi:hypothetical protein